MMLFILGVFGCLLAYVGLRWHGSLAENNDLRLQVASLKRQLRRHTRQTG